MLQFPFLGSSVAVGRRPLGGGWRRLVRAEISVLRQVESGQTAVWARPGPAAYVDA